MAAGVRSLALRLERKQPHWTENLHQHEDQEQQQGWLVAVFLLNCHSNLFQ
jgi:hypothetical protein